MVGMGNPEAVAVSATLSDLITGVSLGLLLNLGVTGMTTKKKLVYCPKMILIAVITTDY